MRNLKNILLRYLACAKLQSMNDENKKIGDFLKALSTEEKVTLAKKADTSVAYLRQLASGNRNAGWPTIQKLVAADSRISIDMFESID